jgi:ribonuclease P protein component
VIALPRGRFSAAQRVRKRSEFQRIQARGRRVVTRHFVFLVSARQPEGGPRTARLGITASRKVGNAVVRNRAKRLIREAFRATRALWPKDVDLVVIVKRNLGDMKLADVVGEWLESEPAIARSIAESRKDRQQLASGLANPS